MTFYDENTHKIKNRKEFPQLDKKYLLKATSSFIFNGERLDALPVTSETKQRYLSTFVTFIQYCTTDLSQLRKKYK